MSDFMSLGNNIPQESLCKPDNYLRVVKTGLLTMILAVAATEIEMQALHRESFSSSCRTLVSGIGPVESCLQLTRYLEKSYGDISFVINFGVGGAFIGCSGQQPALLDVCIARTEVFGDLGICFPLRIDDFGGDISAPKLFQLDSELREGAEAVMRSHGIAFLSGNFVTVTCVSGTKKRGVLLAEKYNGVCENMEGAALARVCQEFSLPFLELRCISNFVEDRNSDKWKLVQACDKSGRTAACIIEEMEDYGAA